MLVEDEFLGELMLFSTAVSGQPWSETKATEGSSAAINFRSCSQLSLTGSGQVSSIAFDSLQTRASPIRSGQPRLETKALEGSSAATSSASSPLSKKQGCVVPCKVGLPANCDHPNSETNDKEEFSGQSGISWLLSKS